jgi:hypothetical protein
MRVEVLTVRGNGVVKRNVLIVSVLLPIAIHLALRSNMQRRVDVLRVQEDCHVQDVGDLNPPALDPLFHDRLYEFQVVAVIERNCRHVKLFILISCQDNVRIGCFHHPKRHVL